MRACNTSSVAPIEWVAPAAQAPASPPALALGRLAPALPPGMDWGPAAGAPASPIAVDAQAAGKLAIARGEWNRETAPFREPEISGRRRASVMVAGRFAGGGGGRAAAFRGGGGRSFSGGRGGGFRGGGGGRSRRWAPLGHRAEHDVVLLGRLDNGLGYYRFAYNGSDRAYVGAIAQEVRAVRPDAVAVGRDGYLRVSTNGSDCRSDRMTIGSHPGVGCQSLSTGRTESGSAGRIRRGRLVRCLSLLRQQWLLLRQLRPVDLTAISVPILLLMRTAAAGTAAVRLCLRQTSALGKKRTSELS